MNNPRSEQQFRIGEREQREVYGGARRREGQQRQHCAVAVQRQEESALVRGMRCPARPTRDSRCRSRVVTSSFPSTRTANASVPLQDQVSLPAMRLEISERALTLGPLVQPLLRRLLAGKYLGSYVSILRDAHAEAVHRGRLANERQPWKHLNLPEV